MNGAVADVLTTSGPYPARIFRPSQPSGCAVLVWHGGAWSGGGGAAGFEERDADDRALCRDLGAVVVDVDYPLAPQETFPSQSLHAACAMEWLSGGLAGTGVSFDPTRIAVHATSSGAQAVVSMLLAARDGIHRLGSRHHPAAVALVVPSLDLRTEARIAGRSPQEATEAIAVRDNYFVGVDRFDDSLVSPAFAPRITGLPPMSVALGAFDPLREGGETFCRRALEQGAEVRPYLFPTTHTDGEPAVLEARHQALAADLREWLCGA